MTSGRSGIVAVVYSSSEEPTYEQPFPHEIHLWFQTGTGKAFVGCEDGWKEWVRGKAIKEVCLKDS